MHALTSIVSWPGAIAAMLIAATLYASQAVALRVFGDAGRNVRWSASVAIGLGAAMATFQWLLTFGRFRVPESLAIAAIATAAVRGLTGVRVGHVVQLLGEDLTALSRFLFGPIKWLWPLRAALIAAAGNVVARALILPPLGYDTLTYHGPRAAAWATTGRDVALRMPGGWSMFRLFPSGGESLGAWAMLPFHDDTFYILVDAMLWLAWLPALIVICAELDVPRRVHTALCLYAMTVPAIYYFVPSGYVEVSSYLLLVTMTAFAIRAMAGKTPRASACIAVMCSLLALTIKVTALVMPVIATIAMLVAVRRDATARAEVLRGIGLGVLAGACALGPMLVRTTLHNGHPFSPFPMRVLGMTLGVAAPELAWWNEPPVDQTLANDLLQLRMLFGLHEQYWASLGATSIPLLLLAPFGAMRLFRERPWGATLLVTLMASQIASYLHPAFTASRLQLGWVNGRFFALLPTLAALQAPWIWRRPAAQRLITTYFVLASAYSVSWYVHFFVAEREHRPLVWMLGLGVLALALVELVERRMGARTLGLAAVVLLGIAGAFGTPPLQHYRTHTRYRALATSAVGQRIHWFISEFAEQVDQPHEPHRIAITAGPNKMAGGQHLYYFLGSKLQNELVYVSPARDGSIPVYDRDQPVTPLLTPKAWRDRVRGSRASHVVVLAPAWHEFGWLMRAPKEFELAGTNALSSMFRVRR